MIDKVELGVGENRTTHLVTKGKENFRAELKKSFPDAKDHKSIDKFFEAMRVKSFFSYYFPHYLLCIKFKI